MSKQILSYVGSVARISLRDYETPPARFQVTVYSDLRRMRCRYFAREAAARAYAQKQIAMAGPAVPQVGGAVS